MYDLPDFYLIANPIDRYSIGDRTPGLRRDSDGSLTIVIQHEQPADTSNWLPGPRRAVPADPPPVPAAGRPAGRHLQDPAHHEGHELDLPGRGQMATLIPSRAGARIRGSGRYVQGRHADRTMVLCGVLTWRTRGPEQRKVGGSAPALRQMQPRSKKVS